MVDFYLCWGKRMYIPVHYVKGVRACSSSTQGYVTTRCVQQKFLNPEPTNLKGTVLFFWAPSTNYRYKGLRSQSLFFKSPWPPKYLTGPWTLSWCSTLYSVSWSLKETLGCIKSWIQTRLQSRKRSSPINTFKIFLLTKLLRNGWNKRDCRKRFYCCSVLN
jgi:hypothetical protein